MLFEGVESQFIDDSGKTRILSYPNLSLLTSPLPSLDLKAIHVKRDQDVPVVEADLDVVLEFVKTKDLTITKKDGNEEEGIQGLWVISKNLNSGIHYGYIPLKPIPSPKELSKIKYVEVHQNDPIRTDGKANSKLAHYKRSKRVADYLKEYVLYTYALYVGEEGDEKGDSLESFAKKAFAIVPGHVYNIERLNKRLFKEGNDIMYDAKGRLIVTTEDIKVRLLSYLKVRLLNDRASVLVLANLSSVTDYYQSISDFRKAPNTMIFTSKRGIKRWLDAPSTTDKNYVALALIPEEVEPYFYRSQNIKRGALFLIQNVEGGGLAEAKTVSRKWIKDRVNLGYFARVTKKIVDVSHTTYTDLGKVSKKGAVGKAGTADVVLYEDGTYGAILFLRS
jgi:hypothetical protein